MRKAIMIGQQVQVSTEHGPRTGLIVDIWHSSSYIVMTKGIFPHKWELHICKPDELRNIIELDYDQAYKWYVIYKTGVMYGITPTRAYLSESPMIVGNRPSPIIPSTLSTR